MKKTPIKEKNYKTITVEHALLFAVSYPEGNDGRTHTPQIFFPTKKEAEIAAGFGRHIGHSGDGQVWEAKKEVSELPKIWESAEAYGRTVLSVNTFEQIFKTKV